MGKVYKTRGKRAGAERMAVAPPFDDSGFGYMALCSADNGSHYRATNSSATVPGLGRFVMRPVRREFSALL
jgi:hypothetical protein